MVPGPLFEIEGSNLGSTPEPSPGFEPGSIVFANRRRLLVEENLLRS